jgi:hypothetical protein
LTGGECVNNKKPSEWTESISDLEIDMLLLYFTFSDQFGRVDVLEASNYAAKKLGFIISKEPFTISQQHLDILMDRGVLPDVRMIFNKIMIDPSLNDDEI